MDILEYGVYMQMADDASDKAIPSSRSKRFATRRDNEFENYLLVRHAEGPAKYALERRQWEKKATAYNPSPRAARRSSSPRTGRAGAAGHPSRLQPPAQDALRHYEELLEATRQRSLALHCDRPKDEHQLDARLGRVQLRQLRTMRVTPAARRCRHPGQSWQSRNRNARPERRPTCYSDLKRPQEALTEYEISRRTTNRFTALRRRASAKQVQQKREREHLLQPMNENCEGIRRSPRVRQRKPSPLWEQGVEARVFSVRTRHKSRRLGLDFFANC